MASLSSEAQEQATFRTELGGPFAHQLAAFQVDWRAFVDSTHGIPLRLRLNAKLAAEEFSINIGREVTIEAGTGIGAAWALATLATDLLDGELSRGITRQKPAYGFRGICLDVARRYHSPDTLRTLVRWCSLAKIRVVQLHLTDDQNWMLPTEVLKGVDRNNTHGKPAYTRRELIDLQSFANARGVAIIPEIDLPGHSSLLVRHDPALFKIQGSPSGGCVNFGFPEVRRRLKALLDETAKLFPEAPYIHIGGDEAWYPDAEKDPQMQAAMKALGAGKGPQDVFVDFVGELADHVLKLGKTPIVWEGFHAGEFTKSRIPKETLVVAWEGPYYPAKQLVPDGFRVVNAGWDPHYVVNHYPYDVNTLVPLERLLGWTPQRFGIVNWGSLEEAGFRFQGPVQGSLMCWWEGHEWNALTLLPPRILASGASLWDARKKPTYGQLLATWRQAQAWIQSGGASQFPPKKEATVERSLTTGKPVQFWGERDPQFGVEHLVDGISDDPTAYWLAYPNPQSATIDLRSVQTVARIQVVSLWVGGQPTSYLVEGSSDGKVWQVLVDRPDNKEAPTSKGYTDTFPVVQVRYLRLTTLGSGLFPRTMSRILELRAFGDR
jgi:hexosaminidase